MQNRFTRTETFVVRISLTAVMTALVAVATFIVRVPNAMGGYFNFGDVAIFAVASTFGPLVSGFSGGVGSAIADAIGFPIFVIPTLIIKGIEGLVAGLISNRKSLRRDVLAVVVAGCLMIVGYFVVEAYVLDWGIGGALSEVPGNIVQVIVGGVVGVPISHVIRKRLPPILK
jgi:uncharacterized membrane protein